MNKLELLKHKKYFTSPSIILEIFKDEDEIPIEIIHLMIHKEEPKAYVLRVTPEIHNYLTNLIKEEYEHSRNKSKKL